MKHRNRLSIYIVGFMCAFAFVSVVHAQSSAATNDGTTSVPSLPDNDSTLVDPATADFSSDVLSEDFTTDGSGDGTTTSTDTTDTIEDTTTDAIDSSATSTATSTTTTTVTPTTTTVTDTPAGPVGESVFWVAFFGIILVLLRARGLFQKKSSGASDVY
ncbi:hypothetical protein COS66_00225 [Candidatus Berkelbacteria bacterium CG06_land_8_20_14_3_00_43_10]|nr:MAG: hypothetical protein AUK41_02795 [Candidatus Berkelbacteria bacterium CG2_30_43_20]PIU87553.1 MAG: hypothetical protein COS66_00225 [Candidatus Berkelbacteria bacterium CG06_land_8_20_14_3_00_43_10]